MTSEEKEIKRLEKELKKRDKKLEAANEPTCLFHSMGFLL